MKTNNEHELEKDELTGDELLSGHDYDGIQELNNPMPKWWLWLFYLTIVFAAIYYVRYEVMYTGISQAEEYENEMSEAARIMDSQRTKVLDETNVAVLTDEAGLAEGKAIYDKLCLVCHLSNGEGLVGPNLTDEYWIHGGSIGDIFKIIKIGNPSMGMISWKDQLTPVQIQQVASFIYHFEGTNPPNQKAAQGE
ncbi:MAG: cytochrome c class i, partial [Bacteroidetes bacterium HGW-Bacteroidetes-17]